MGRGRAQPAVRAEARRLRLQGRSYREIHAALGVAMSTLSGWLADVPLTEEHRARLAERSTDGARDRAAAVRAGRIRRTETLQAAAAGEIGGLSERELFLLGVVAYWCEGSKAKPWAASTPVKFINSDPELIRLFLRWLRLVGIGDDDLQLNVSIHERADVAAAVDFWAGVSGRPAEHFGRTWLKRHNPTTERHNVGSSYVGCLVVTVRRSTDLNRRIAGWWRGIADALPQPAR